MSNFCMREGQFWINDQPLLIHAGEFHYFRCPPEDWRARLQLLLDAGFNTLAVYIPWLWHQIAEDENDVDGHSHPMRDLEGFLELATDMDFWLIPRPGPYIMAETINEGIPPWVFDNYPDVAFINQNEERQNIVSYLHPDFLAAVEKWYEAVFAVLSPRQITNGGRIIMVQLDNEMAMPHWVRNIFDINPDTLARFATYLQDTYGDQLSALYPTDDLPTFLRDGITHPEPPYADKIVRDYRHFYREYLYQYMDFLWQSARANRMDVPPIVNVHGFTNDRGGRTFPIGLSQLIKVIEMPGMVTATDVYPIFIGEGNIHQLVFINEMTRAVQNPDQALFSVEFQSGGNNDFSGAQLSMYDLHSRLCLSVGMRAINHYLFYAGENHSVLSPIRRHDWGPPVRLDGSVRSHYPRYGRLSRVLNAYGDALTLAHPQNVTTIGFLMDNFMTEVNNEFTRQDTAVIAYQRDVALFDFIARGLILTHRPYDAVELVRTELSVANTPTLWVMMDKQCPAEVQTKLVEYVEQGGKLVMVGRICEADFEGKPTTILLDALGVGQTISDAPFIYTEVRVFGYPYVPAAFIESYDGDFDEVFARRATGEPIGFVKSVGQGRVIHFGATLPADTLEDLDIVHQIANRIGCDPLFTLSEWADVRLSRGEAGNFLFITNYQDDPASTVVTYAGETLFGGNPIELPARRGFILPLEWRVNDDVLVHYATSEVTGITTTDDGITLTVEPAAFVAELTLDGYYCESDMVVQEDGEKLWVRVEGKEGRIVLRKNR